MKISFSLSGKSTLEQIEHAMKVLGASSFTFDIQESENPSFLVKETKEKHIQEKVDDIVSKVDDNVVEKAKNVIGPEKIPSGTISESSKDDEYSTESDDEYTLDPMEISDDENQ